MINAPEITDIWKLPFFYNQEFKILDIDTSSIRERKVNVIQLEIEDDIYWIRLDKDFMVEELNIGDTIVASKEALNRGARLNILEIKKDISKQTT